MESATIDSMCRCCAAEGIFKDIKTSYHWMGEEEVYGDMLRECLDVKLSSVEEGGICEVCITQLRNAANFKKQVLHTEKKFKRHLESRRFKPTEVKEEVSGDNENNSSDDDRGVDSEDDEDYVPEFEIPIKTESLEESKSRKRTAKATTSRAKKSRVDDDKSDQEDEQVRVTGKSNKSDREELIKQKHNLQQILLSTNATPIRRHTDTGYVCSFCPKYFVKAEDLKKHTLSHDTEEYYSFMGKTILSSFIVKLDVTNLQCNICDDKIEHFSSIIDHLKSHNQFMHTDIGNYLVPFKFENDLYDCTLCSEVCRTFISLQKHMCLHYRNFVCDQCDAGFINYRTMTRHYSYTHKVGRYPCCQCDETFDTKSKRRSHENRTHCDIKRSKCGYCGEKFRTSNLKWQHQIKMHKIEVPLLNCNACDRTFTTPFQLRAHIKRDHLMEERFKCTYCPSGFYHKSQLDEHIVIHTHEKKFKCEICDKSFARTKALYQHIKIHVGERRFRCTICNTAYVQKCNWKRHMLKIHNAVLD